MNASNAVTVLTSTMTRRPRRAAVRWLAMFAALALAGPASLRAADGTWMSSTDGLWSDAANWLNGLIADGSGATAVFSNELSAAVTVNLDSTRVVGQLDFAQGSYTITNNNDDANLLVLDAPTQPVISVPSGMTATIRRTSLAGMGGFILQGGGTLSLMKDDPTPTEDPVDSEIGVAANTISGDVILTNGSTLQVAQGYENARVVDVTLGGITSFTFYEGSTLNLVNDPSTGPNYGFMHANLIVPQDHSGTILVPPRWSNTAENTGSGMDGSLTGGGTLNLQVRYVRGNIGGDWSAFTGQINVSAAAGSDSQWRFGNAAGFPNAAVHLTGTLALNARYYPAPGGEVVIPIGALTSDNPLASLNGGNGGTTVVTFRIGGLRTDPNVTDTFMGTLYDGTGLRIIKEGAGTWVLTGDNAYSGGTTISNGVLQVGDGFSEAGSLGSGPVTNYGTLVFARAGTLTVLGAIEGTGSISNAASGTVILAGANTCSGPTRVGAGQIVLGSGSQLAGAVSVADSAALGAKVTTAGGSVGLGGLTFGAGSSFNLDLGNFGNPSAAVVTASGNLAVNGPVTVNVTGSGLTAGTITLLQYGSRSGGGSFVLGTLPAGISSATLTEDTANRRLVLTLSSVTDPTLRWVGAPGGDWDIDNPANRVWRAVASGQLTNYFDGAMVRFDDTASGTTEVNLVTTVSPSSLLVDNSARDYTFTGAGGVGGAVTLVKQGTGKLTLNTANTYTGGTLINSGTVQVGDGVAAATLGSGNVTNNGLLVFNSAADNTVSGVISGSGAVVQNGPGVLTLSGANTHTGGLEINDSTLAFNNAAAAGAGGASIRLNNGLLSLGANLPTGNPLVVSGSSALVTTAVRETRVISGTNAVLAITNGARLDMRGDMQGFYGTIVFASETAQDIRLYGALGSSNALFYFNTPAGLTNWFYNRNAGTVYLGALAGGPVGLGQQSTAGGANLVTYVIGGVNTNTAFTGVINDAARFTAFTKVGSSTLTLSNVALAHKGAMTVTDGVLAFAGGTVNSPVTTNVTVTAPGVLDLTTADDPTLRLGTGAAVQTLAGNGTIRGALVLGGNARLEPGATANSTGVLTVTGNATLGGQITMELNRDALPTSDQLAAAGFTGSATLTVVNLGTSDFAPGDTFRLFSGPVSGVTLAGDLPPITCPTLQWTNKLAVDGTLAIIGTSCAPVATNIVATFVNGSLDLSWPADYTGWVLQSNSVSLTDPTQWYPVDGSTATNRVILTPDPAHTNVFFRLQSP